jgi:hypothetical protein
VAGPNVARESGLQPGDTITLRTAGGDTAVRIVGIDRNQQNSGRSFYVPLRWLQQSTGWGDTVNMLWLSRSDPDPDHDAIDRATNAVEDSLTAAGYRVAPEKLYALEAENKAANDAILDMIIVVGGVVVAIGMVGLVNSITMNVIERTREIGVLRCVGARARDIRRTFAAESVVQAVLGWTLGLPLGLLLSSVSKIARGCAMSGEDLVCASTATLRRRGVGNLLRMGHCAPSVMKALLDASGSTARWPVLLTAGLPGGIGNSGGECGGLTAPLVLLGLEHGRAEAEDGLPVVVGAGCDLLARFADVQGTTQCRAIRGTSRVPLRCIGVVREAPAMCASCVAAAATGAVSPEAREAYRRLYDHWKQEGFHCADAVLCGCATSPAPDAELRDAVTAFMGGTVFAGMTCSALTAGVMALGLALGEIEDSHVRVARMLAMMAVGGDAFADEVNAFNRVMNLGHELAEWFEAEFGSIRCRELTGCDFASTADVDDYLERDGTVECSRLARRVAERVSAMVDDAGATSRPDGTGPAG